MPRLMQLMSAFLAAGLPQPEPGDVLKDENQQTRRVYWIYSHDLTDLTMLFFHFFSIRGESCKDDEFTVRVQHGLAGALLGDSFAWNHEQRHLERQPSSDCDWPNRFFWDETGGGPPQALRSFKNTSKKSFPRFCPHCRKRDMLSP